MRILFTGVSSFTGMHFVEELLAQGHDVVVTTTQQNYVGLRKIRLERIRSKVTLYTGVSFGDSIFLDIIRKGCFDIFCYHGFYMDNYQEPTYNFQRAYAENTQQLDMVCALLAKGGCKKIVYSNSIFADQPIVFSPYGLVKQLTLQTIQFYAMRYNMQVCNFVISNPFGPLDNPKLLQTIANTWSMGGTPDIWVGDHVRDYIHVGLLSRSFAYCIQIPGVDSVHTYRPCGMVGATRDFIAMMSKKFQICRGWDCRYNIVQNRKSIQPLVMINTDSVEYIDWDEQKAWQEWMFGVGIL